jgi:hypothetical protein
MSEDAVLRTIRKKFGPQAAIQAEVENFYLGWTIADGGEEYEFTAVCVECGIYAAAAIPASEHADTSIRGEVQVAVLRSLSEDCPHVTEWAAEV